jgi:hypothetical protein
MQSNTKFYNCSHDVVQLRKTWAVLLARGGNTSKTSRKMALKTSVDVGIGVADGITAPQAIAIKTSLSSVSKKIAVTPPGVTMLVLQLTSAAAI